MKHMLLLIALHMQCAYAQQTSCDHIFIITTDGFRWQELFNGADSAILFNDKYVKDTATSGRLYWAATPEERRKKLMPFTWNYLSTKGQLWGNLRYDNHVSVANPYRFSYAGYNELLTGYADRSVIANRPKNNGNKNMLAYLQRLPAFKNKVALFSSWNLFPYILNETKSGIPLNSGYAAPGPGDLTAAEQVVDYMQQHVYDNTVATRSDLLTFSLATEYIKKNHPRIMYIGFGETDEFAHHKEYDQYLAQANMVDKFIAELWSMAQRDPFYAGKTTFFITTDHGRGRKPANWHSHGPFVPGSDETWMMQIGPNIRTLGEIKAPSNIFTEQFAQTMAAYLGEIFVAEHPVAESAVSLLQVPGMQ